MDSQISHSNIRFSLVRRAVQYISTYIKQNRLSLGDSLPSEAQLAEDLEVSKTVVREAFGALAALGVLDVSNGRRARVGAFENAAFSASLNHGVVTDQVSLSEVWEVRIAMEIKIAELAAVNRSDAQSFAISKHAEAMRDFVHDLAIVVQHDVAFHEAIATASGNALFRQIICSFSPLMREVVKGAWETRKTESQRYRMVERHLRVAQAIEDRNPENAAEFMAEHFESSIGKQLF